MGEAGEGGRRFGLTRLEASLDAWAHSLLDRAAERGVRTFLIEFVAFGAKQAWATIFGFLILVAIVLVRTLYPDDAAVDGNDLLTVLAVLIQVLMVATGLETRRELRVIVLFHVVGTIMEVFKTDVGSWSYDAGGLLRVGGVPLFTGFMYAAIGSYMVRVYRLFDLRFTRYPPLWSTALVAVGIYANFFTHHWILDLRWFLLAAVVLLWFRTTMTVRLLRRTIRIPLLAAFAGVALFIWFAENIGTRVGAWAYPDQADGWELVSPSKIISWFLLMIISVVLVTWVYPPKTPEPDERMVARPA